MQKYNSYLPNEFDINYLNIKRLIDFYSDSINHRDWSSLEFCFDKAATWQTKNFIDYKFEGPSAIVQGLRSIIDAMDMLVQLPTAVAVRCNGEEATARTTIQEFGRGKDLGFQCLGSYRDQLVKVDDEWRFASREFTYLFWDDQAHSGLVVPA